MIKIIEKERRLTIGRWIKIITGSIIGVGAIVAAPFTGGGFLLTGAPTKAGGLTVAASTLGGNLAHEMADEELVKTIKEIENLI